MIESNFGEHLETGLSVNQTVTFDLPKEVTERSHLYLKMWFTNSGSDATPSAGTVDSVSLAALGNSDEYEVMTNGSSIDATSPIDLLDASGPYVSCQIVTSGISGADGISVKIVAYRN